MLDFEEAENQQDEGELMDEDGDDALDESGYQSGRGRWK